MRLRVLLHKRKRKKKKKSLHIHPGAGLGGEKLEGSGKHTPGKNLADWLLKLRHWGEKIGKKMTLAANEEE